MTAAVFYISLRVSLPLFFFLGFVTSKIDRILLSENMVKRFINAALRMIHIRNDHIALVRHPQIPAGYMPAIRKTIQLLRIIRSIKFGGQCSASRRIGINQRIAYFRILLFQTMHHTRSQPVKRPIAAIDKPRNTEFCNSTNNLLAKKRLKIVRYFSMTEKSTKPSHITSIHLTK